MHEPSGDGMSRHPLLEPPKRPVGEPTDLYAPPAMAQAQNPRVYPPLLAVLPDSNRDHIARPQIVVLETHLFRSPSSSPRTPHCRARSLSSPTGRRSGPYRHPALRRQGPGQAPAPAMLLGCGCHSRQVTLPEPDVVLASRPPVISSSFLCLTLIASPFIRELLVRRQVIQERPHRDRTRSLSVARRHRSSSLGWSSRYGRLRHRRSSPRPAAR